MALAAALLVLAGPARAGFIENRAGWLNLTQSERVGYAMGLHDGLLLYSRGDKAEEALVRGGIKCFQALGIDSSAIMEMINKGYRDNVSDWGEPPMKFVVMARATLCRSYINDKRVELGLKPWLAN